MELLEYCAAPPAFEEVAPKRLSSCGGDGGSEQVEVVAYLLGEHALVVAVLKGRDQQQLATRAGVKVLACGLRQRREAVIHYLYHLAVSLLSSFYHLLLARADGGRHEHHATPRQRQEVLHALLYLLLAQLAGALHGGYEGALEQEHVAQSFHLLPAGLYRFSHPEEIAVVAFHPQPPRVVVYIAHHVAQLVARAQYQVVVVALPQRRGDIHLAGGDVAHLFKGFDDIAQMHLGLLRHMKDAVEVVGHELAPE